MAKRSIVPFGPQHPVLPEPVHLDLVLEDETVVGAVPSIGYIHRGLEKLVEKRDFKQYVYIAERVCGICSCGHGLGYCEAVEQVMGIEVPDRAKYLRTIWMEMSRVHSHLLWLGLLADAMGFESLFMESWRLREKILDMFDETTGGRIIHSVNCVGGVQKDMDSSMLNDILHAVKDLEGELKPVVETFLQDYTVQSRLKGTGILTKENAIAMGAVGPMLRASGVEYDARLLGYAAYKDLTVAPVTSQECDSYARCEVRLKELMQSFELIREAIGKIPEGDISVPVKGNPSGEFFMRIEQPRGEAIYYVKGNGTKYLDRFRLRTPTTSNIPPMVEMLKGCQLADVPVLILTIDPCVSCTER
ncbi:NADH-quinone oxidoreductase subunit D [Lachnoclostridium sp. An169]|uniref:hydrogenase large subunit n=1 Tax=Lachnoclostridium sp. An169 TaxID=1965569 RepID=UPI000B394471|nr:nickel-dependent hydrogenase large subunit [Lachnoclostridium sp. An169]OUP81341.1 NADH-quinone oxidoreductase subunit D [Lachnoclostridium sp. An169]HJA66191.1 nickel-dependent hydrogenase large subunit [Candidatus Mediterraneibacter cottocaccae]